MQQKKTTIFLPKMNKVFLSPILQNLKERSVLDNTHFENDPLDEPKKIQPSKQFYIFRKSVKNGKWRSKSNLRFTRVYIAVTLQTAKFVPLKRVLKGS